MRSQSLGRYGEEQACLYLKNKGYQILEKNFHNKLGEIDIIAKDGSIICFVEVKIRTSLSYGAPFEAVSSIKQYKIVKVALSYLKYKFATIDISSRFDVISIYGETKETINIEHIINAFDLTYLSH